MTNAWDDYADGWDSDKDVRLYSENAFESLADAFSLEGARVLKISEVSLWESFRQETFLDRVWACPPQSQRDVGGFDFLQSSVAWAEEDPCRPVFVRFKTCELWMVNPP